MVHENWRFRPHFRQILQWLRAGEIGEPRAFRLDTLGASLIAPEGGGMPPGLARQPFLAQMKRLIVLELLVHQLDTLQCLFGPVSVNMAALERISPHVIGEDTATLHLNAGSAKGVLFASWVAKGQTPLVGDGLYIVGSEGTIEFRKDKLTLHGERQQLELTFDLEAGYQASYDNTIAHFIRCLTSDAPFETPPEVHIAILEAVEAIYAFDKT
jgi:predicted dehydrogenase